MTLKMILKQPLIRTGIPLSIILGTLIYGLIYGPSFMMASIIVVTTVIMLFLHPRSSNINHTFFEESHFNKLFYDPMFSGLRGNIYHYKRDS